MILALSLSLLCLPLLDTHVQYTYTLADYYTSHYTHTSLSFITHKHLSHYPQQFRHSTLIMSPFPHLFSLSLFMFSSLALFHWAVSLPDYFENDSYV